MPIEKAPPRRDSQGSGSSSGAVSPSEDGPSTSAATSTSSHSHSHSNTHSNTHSNAHSHSHSSSHSHHSHIPSHSQGHSRPRSPLEKASSVRAKFSKLTKQLSTKIDLASSKLDLSSMTMSSLRTIYSGMSLPRVVLAGLLFTAILFAIWTLPLEQTLKRFLLWLKHVGPFWGPFIMAVAYIPLNLLALPVSILTLGGGYVFGLFVGFAADSIGSTAGATAAFLVGKTLCRAYVLAKLREYPQFQVIAHAISKSGFKIVLLLRLVPIFPVGVMNYVLSVTPISMGTYILASWIGMMPVTFAFVYLGTTIKDISEIGSPEAAIGSSHWWMLGTGLVLTITATALITRVAKEALERAIEEHEASAPDTAELMARNSDAGASGGGASSSSCAGASTGVRMPSPKAGILSGPFQTKSSGGKGGKQPAVQGLDVGLKEGAKGVLVRIEGSLLHSPKVEKGG